MAQQCSCGTRTVGGSTCRSCAGAAPQAAEPSSPVDAVAGQGRPLPSSLREEMEQAFDTDFSGVRVHVGARATQSAIAVGANAYTYGQHIVFRQEQFAPSSTTGKRLIAHELAHTVQQRAAATDAARVAPVHEVEAAHAAQAAVSGGRAAPVSPSPRAVALDRASDEKLTLADIDLQVKVAIAQLNLPSEFISERAMARIIELQFLRKRLVDGPNYQEPTQKQLNSWAREFGTKQAERRLFWNALEDVNNDLVYLRWKHDADFRRKAQALDLYWNEAGGWLERRPFIDVLERDVMFNREAKLEYSRAYDERMYNEPEKVSTFRKAMRWVCENTNPCHDNMEQYRADLDSGMSIAEARARYLMRLGIAFWPTRGPQGPITRGPGGTPGGGSITAPKIGPGTLEPVPATGPPIVARTAKPTITDIPVVPIPKPTVKPNADPAPKDTPQVKPDPAPTVKPTPTPTPTAKPTPTPKPATKPTPKTTTDTDVVPMPRPDTRQRQKCTAPTGLTPQDPIPISWFKPRHNSFYPETIDVVRNGVRGRIERDDPKTKLPDGTPVGVKADYWPRLGKIMQLIPQRRTGKQRQYREVLAEWGFQWGSTLQPDHVQDIDWEGPDIFGNLWPYEASTNQSAGSSQNVNQEITFCLTKDGPHYVDRRLRTVKRMLYGRYFVIRDVRMHS